MAGVPAAGAHREYLCGRTHDASLRREEANDGEGTCIRRTC